MNKRILALALCLMILLCACAKPHSSTSPTEASTVPSSPAESSAPTQPTVPTEPEILSEHQKLHRYISTSADRVDGMPARIEKKDTYTFTMLAQKDGSIRWEYSNESITVSVTLVEGNTTCDVAITLSLFTGLAAIDMETYTNAEHQLKGFYTGAPESLAEGMKAQATTCVWICMMDAETAIAPADVTLASLGFVCFYE